MGNTLEFRGWRGHPITPRLESPKSHPSGCVSEPSRQILSKKNWTINGILEFLARIDNQNPDPPFDEKTIDAFRSFITSFLEEHSCIADWTIRPYQPMTLNIMSQLGFLMHVPHIDLFPSLMAGVSIGFNNDISPSNIFGPNDRPKLPETPLSVHLANWQSAEVDPDTTRRLVQEELDQGWVFEFKGTIEEAKIADPNIAVGRLGVAFSDTRPPRLVVDSSVCGVNNRCIIPELTTLPPAKDVI